MSFRDNNKLSNILKPKTSLLEEEKTGFYKLTCNDCEYFYIGQTGRGFYKRFREHISKNQSIYDHNHIKSNYARHLTQHNHNYTDLSQI